ncbi:hypothetical protein BKN38_00140 [Helicobacter sp. CLO-3]|uniref:MFS transporter n=1 Tax=unclassified Helicobacter TaxID=2593540 RepID=UPI000805DCC2|nr:MULTISPECIES: MFS transporter [unclassified Helicobacter]OBV28782.1 hypothetical protein BA723_01540 [Helicobacter sp. CLO-3]OHU85852.1 hypothetical protein BKN38_00140 [Helicobacter sp. CLO-3]
MRTLTKDNKRALWLSSLGGTLEFYDFIIFLFFINAITQQFFPKSLGEFWANLNTYGAFAAAYFARPLGGVIMAHFGDKNGRKNMFMLSIVLMVIPTFTLGVMPTFESIGYAAPIILFLIRILQGIAIGGELPGAWVFVSEHTRKDRRALATGILTASVAGGILLGCIVAIIVRLIFSAEEINEWAYRIPFILGGIFGIIAAFLRRYLEETPVFQEIRKSNAQHNFPVKEVLARAKIPSIITMIYTWVLTCAVVVITLTMPKFVGAKLGFSEVQIVLLQMLVVAGMCSGCVIAGILSDKIGVYKACYIFHALFIIGALTLFGIVFEGLEVATDAILALYFVCGLGVGSAIFAPVFALRLFPSKIRFSGLSFSYNIAYAIFGGFAPTFVSACMGSGNPFFIAVYVAIVGVLGLVTALIMSASGMLDKVVDEHD